MTTYTHLLAHLKMLFPNKSQITNHKYYFPMNHKMRIMAKKIQKGINGPESRETERKGGRDRERFEEEGEEEEDEEEEEEEEEKGI